ncbi:hypothetical protein F240042I4_46730 [Eisenbergiella tayi]
MADQKTAVFLAEKSNEGKRRKKNGRQEIGGGNNLHGRGFRSMVHRCGKESGAD